MEQAEIEDLCSRCEHKRFNDWIETFTSCSDVFNPNKKSYYCWLFHTKPKDVSNCQFFMR